MGMYPVTDAITASIELLQVGAPYVNGEFRL